MLGAPDHLSYVVRHGMIRRMDGEELEQALDHDSKIPREQKQGMPLTPDISSSAAEIPIVDLSQMADRKKTATASDEILPSEIKECIQIFSGTNPDQLKIGFEELLDGKSRIRLMHSHGESLIVLYDRYYP